MTHIQALQRHQQLCDELYALSLEENRFLKENRRPTGQQILERKGVLLQQLKESLDALRTSGPGTPGDPARKEVIEKARARILQILHLDRENEQLLLRYSITRGLPAAPPTVASPTQLQKLYDRHG